MLPNLGVLVRGSVSGMGPECDDDQNDEEQGDEGEQQQQTMHLVTLGRRVRGPGGYQRIAEGGATETHQTIHLRPDEGGRVGFIVV